MATGYVDHIRLSFIKEQSALLYFQRVFMALLDAITVTDERFIPVGETLVLKNSVTVGLAALLLCMGTITVTEVP